MYIIAYSKSRAIKTYNTLNFRVFPTLPLLLTLELIIIENIVNSFLTHKKFEFKETGTLVSKCIHIMIPINSLFINE